MSKPMEKIINLLILIMIVSLVGSFTLFFMGFYKTAFALGGVFMFLAAFLGQWSGNNGADYVFRDEYENNRNKWNNKW